MAAQAGLGLTWSQTPKTGFLVTRLISLRQQSTKEEKVFKFLHVVVNQSGT